MGCVLLAQHGNFILNNIGFPISSAQAFAVADRIGAIAVIECCSEKAAIIHPSDQESYVCATNVFHSTPMMKYNVAGIDNWQAEPRYQTTKV